MTDQQKYQIKLLKDTISNAIYNFEEETKISIYNIDIDLNNRLYGPSYVYVEVTVKL